MRKTSLNATNWVVKSSAATWHCLFAGGRSGPQLTDVREVSGRTWNRTICIYFGSHRRHYYSLNA
jgi:hypothetical protein